MEMCKFIISILILKFKRVRNNYKIFILFNF
jgi:hypothetical protein